MRSVDGTRRTDIYIYIYRKFSPVVRLGGLAPARPIRESTVYSFSHKCGVVQAHHISANLLRMNDIRESAVYRVFHISAGWFKHIEPPQKD